MATHMVLMASCPHLTACGERGQRRGKEVEAEGARGQGQGGMEARRKAWQKVKG